mmetsp:Transcript_12643/g.19107  ORF Transcript_12643/g.19107 Transcript_12643/m.19107 type:complete len:217 (-) Transcript_12643:40-690(-)
MIVFLFNFFTFSINIYGLFFLHTELASSHPAGFFVFLTIWNHYLTTLFFFVATIDQAVQLFKSNKSSPSIVSDSLFALLAPTSLTVSLQFWTLFLLDPDLVIPKDVVYPIEMSHLQHTANSIFVIIEVLLVCHKLNTVRDLSIIVPFVLSYLATISVIRFFFENPWPYPILNQLEKQPSAFIAFIGFSLVLFSLLYKVFAMFNTAYHGQSAKKKKL